MENRKCKTIGSLQIVCRYIPDFQNSATLSWQCSKKKQKKILKPPSSSIAVNGVLNCRKLCYLTKECKHLRSMFYAWRTWPDNCAENVASINVLFYFLLMLLVLSCVCWSSHTISVTTIVESKGMFIFLCMMLCTSCLPIWDKEALW